MGTKNLVRRLERQNRILGYAIVVFVSFSFLAGAAVQSGLGKTVRAQTFIVEDKLGNVRATLGLDQKNEALLTFFDTDGKRRVAVGVTQKGPVMAGYTAQGRPTGTSASDSAAVQNEVRSAIQAENNREAKNLRERLRFIALPRPNLR